MVWKAKMDQGAEALKIRWSLVPYTRGLGYDIGCGPVKAFPHFIGIDNNKDEKLFGIPAAAADLIVPDATDLSRNLPSAQADFVFSSHALEHIRDHVKALREWWRIIKPGGHLCLYLPHKDFYPNVGTEGANPDHCHDFHPNDIIEEMKKIGGWDLLVNEDRNEDDEYSFFQVYKKYSDAKVHNFSHTAPKPEKTCGIVRYGAFGDVIQTTSLLPWLKEQGYHITLHTVPRAADVVTHEPLIDRIVVQDAEQVPNPELGPYWDWLSKQYDKFINMSESVEKSLLSQPGHMPYVWNTKTRHVYMNHNYLEFMHLIAEVPYTKPLMRFVPSADEAEWASKEYKRIGGAPLFMFVLRGSSVHKVWGDGLDAVIARIMVTFPRAKVVTVGDKSCQDIIEKPWENEPRIVRRSNVWSIRQTMAMANICDMVIGLETGVMSAVAMEPMPKVVLLSHSSVENLTRDWENTFSVHSTKTECFPCHMLHYGWESCKQALDEQGSGKGIAKCMDDLSPDQVWDAILSGLQVQHDKLERAA